MPNIVSSLVRWLRAGYPNGLPSQDYIPLMAVLKRRLGEEEVAEVSHELVEAGLIPPDTADIGVEITKVTDDMPLPEDVSRVEQQLRDAGWEI